MKPCNLLVHSSGAFALYKNGSDNIKAITSLKNNEIIVLKEMCDVLCGVGCEVSVFEGYFIGYTIVQNSEKRNGCFAFAACRFASAERSVDAICLSLDCACSCH